ncbi:MAG: hypothetical protein V2A57_04535 [Elusimicrobiota bacterium]
MNKIVFKIILLLSLSSNLYSSEVPINVLAGADKKEITLGDTFEYVLNLEYPKDYKFNLPDFTSIFNGFEIRKQTNIAPRSRGWLFGTKHYEVQFKFELTNFNIGDQMISSFTVTFAGPSGEIKESVVPETIVKVTPVKENAQDVQDIRDIKPPLSIGINTLLLFVIIIFILVGAYLYFLMRKKEGPAVEGQVIEEQRLSPEELANKRLDELLAKNLIKEGPLGIKQFYIELSDIIRRYISEKYGVPVIERTTDEVCRDLKKSGQADKKSQIEIKEFLENCDMVKFAKYIPLDNEINGAVEKGREIIKI